MKRRFSGKAMSTPMSDMTDIQSTMCHQGTIDVGHHHVSGEAGGERHGHVTGRGGDRLHRVVFQDREILPETDAREEAKHGEGEDDRGEVNAERHAGFAGDVEIRRGEDAAEKEAGQRRSGW